MPADAALHVGDRVAVKVFNHPELSGEFVVDSMGNIAVPLAGNVRVVGREPGSLAGTIKRALKPYLRDPAVEVQLRTEGSAITVSGWPFAIPDGVVKYVPGQTLAGAVNQIRQVVVGQPTDFDPYRSRIDMRNVSVWRDGNKLGTYDLVNLSGKGEGGPVLHPGDEVRFVNKPIAVRVSGAVKESGFAYLAPDEPLSAALDQMRGVRDTAATSHIILSRDGKEEVLSMADADFARPAKANDSIFVPTAPQVTVGGTVLKPGTVTLKSDFSLLSAIFNAGGPDKTGDLGNITVVHEGVTKKYDVTKLTRGDFSQNPQLRDGDQVYVPVGKQPASASVMTSTLTALRYLIRPF